MSQNVWEEVAMQCMQRLLVGLSVVTWLTLLAGTSPAQEPTESSTKSAGGLEISLLAAPPLPPEQMLMPGMGGMRGMPGMGTMGGMEGQPTHWIGVLVRDAKTDTAVQNLDITLTARQGGVTRTVKLMPMPGSYGANIHLPEKGQYEVTIQVHRPGQPVQVRFDFAYK